MAYNLETLALHWWNESWKWVKEKKFTGVWAWVLSHTHTLTHTLSMPGHRTNDPNRPKSISAGPISSHRRDWPLSLKQDTRREDWKAVWSEVCVVDLFLLSCLKMLSGKDRTCFGWRWWQQWCCRLLASNVKQGLAAVLSLQLAEWIFIQWPETKGCLQASICCWYWLIGLWTCCRCYSVSPHTV